MSNCFVFNDQAYILLFSDVLSYNLMMVRNYQRKTDQALWTPGTMVKSVAACKEGMSVKQASIRYDIPRTTLTRHVKQQVSGECMLGRFKPVFNCEMETELSKHIMDMQERFYGLMPCDVRKLAYEFAETLKIRHPFSKFEKMAGEDWLGGFLKRHQELAIRKPEATSIGRAIGFNKPQVDKFYQNLHSLIQKNILSAYKIWNVDESGLTTVHVPRKIIARKGAKQVGKITSGEKGKTVTTVCCMSAGGTFVPPMLIFPRKNMSQSLLNGAPVGTIGCASPNGWIDAEIFLKWLHHFISHVKPSPTDKHLLVLDGHCSHKTMQVIDLARENGIDILVLPPHTTHRLQPLDTVFYKPLSDNYNKAADQWMLTNPGRRISFYEVASLFGDAYEKTATIGKASSGFRSTGIWPYNPDVFDQAEFAPSSVTDKPLASAADVIVAEPSTSNDQPEQVSSDYADTLLQISPLPKAVVVPGARKRKATGSEVITSSPYKNALVEKKLENKKTARKTAKGKKVTAKVSTQRDTTMWNLWHQML